VRSVLLQLLVVVDISFDLLVSSNVTSHKVKLRNVTVNNLDRYGCTGMDLLRSSLCLLPQYLHDGLKGEPRGDLFPCTQHLTELRA